MLRPTWQVALTVFVLIVFVSPSRADWLRFRGPNGSGVSDDVVPEKWSAKENLKWKIPLPGPGSSSPIVVGDRVFVTCYSGYGLDQGDPGDQEDLRRHILCIDRNDGKTVWSKTVKPVLPEDPFTGVGMPQHGYASHTPVSDGERVYVFFGKTGILAFDLTGNQLWQKSVGTESGMQGWGSSSSPVLYQNLLIVPATAESEAMVALNKLTGDEVWRQEAAGFSGVWGSPVLAKVDEDRTDLVIAVPNEVWALNPSTGKMRWYCDGVAARTMCSSALAHDGVVYVMESGAGGGGGVAVRVGGSKDVTESHVVWSGRQSGRIGTPVLYKNRLYSFSGGVAQCYDASTGDEVGQLRLSASGIGGADRQRVAVGPQSGIFAQQSDDRRRGAFSRGRGRGGFGNLNYGSPVVAAGKLYYQARSGGCYVFSTGDHFEQLALNKVTGDAENFSGTPAISHGALFIRSNKHLYCVASE